MIAFAITCLLVATVGAALLVASDSALRGFHSYRALATELRALRAAASQGAANPLGTTRPVQLRPARGIRRPRRTGAGGLRAAA